jgi:hypothetical protein
MLQLLPAFVLAAAIPSAAEVATSVDVDRVADAVLVLSGEQPIDGGPIVSRNVRHADHLRAATWIEAELEAAGFAVHREELEVLGESTWNVVGELAGSDPDAGRLALTAHYDSTAAADAGWNPSTDPAPGADDDASGIAVILEVARILGSHEPGYSNHVRIVAFTGEEEGLVGSFHHVDALDDPVDLVLNLDPVGHNPGEADLLWVVYEARWPGPADELAAAGDEAVTWLDLRSVGADSLGGDARSDHYPFWEGGIPALHLGTFPQPPQSHTAGDTFDVVDPAMMAEIAAVTAVFASNWAQALEGVEADEGAGCTSCGASFGGSSAAPATLLLLAALAGSRRRRRQSPGCPFDRSPC